jgi:hypothetical protein
VATAPLATTVDGSSAAAPVPTPRVPLPLMAGEIVRAVERGHDALTIELEPVDLGRVAVSLTIDGSGRLRADLAAERPETSSCSSATRSRWSRRWPAAVSNWRTPA